MATQPDPKHAQDQAPGDPGTTASAEEIERRLKNASDDIQHGSAEGQPDPVTYENVHRTEENAPGRSAEGSSGN